MSLNHPVTEKMTLPSTQKLVLVHRGYIVALLKDIFYSSKYVLKNERAGTLEDILERWILFRGTQFGLACDPYSSYSTTDCGGDISNSNSSLVKEDGTLRESFRLQACRQILDSDNAVEAAMEKVNPSNNNLGDKTPIGSRTLVQIYELFYRNSEVDNIIINSLIDLDRTLMARGESMKERWRAVLLVICESPGWQQL